MPSSSGDRRIGHWIGRDGPRTADRQAAASSAPRPATPATRPTPASPSACPSTMPDDRAGSGAERDADADLARALPDHERHHAVDADRREDEREARRTRQQLRREATRRRRRRDQFVHRPDAERRQIRIDGAHLRRERLPEPRADPTASSARATATVRCAASADGRCVGLGSSSMRRVRRSSTTPTTVIQGFFAWGPPRCRRLPDRVLTGPAAARDRVGDDHDRRRLAVVLLARTSGHAADGCPSPRNSAAVAERVLGGRARATDRRPRCLPR